MIRKYYKVGLIDAVAGGVKQIPIPVNLGTITGLYFYMKNGSGAAASVAVVKAALKNIMMTASPKNGMSFDIIKPFTPEKLYRRELNYGSVFGFTANAAELLTYDPSASLFTAESSRAYLNLGTLDLAALTLEFNFMSAITGLSGIETWIEYDPRNNVLGAHVRLGMLTQKVPATGGDVEIVTLPKNTDGSFGYQKIDIGIPANMTVDKVTVVTDNDQYQLREVPVSLLKRGQIECGRTPAADVVTIDFAKEAFANFFLPGQMGDFKVVPHFVPGTGAVESQIDIDYELLYTPKG